jgi:hypothetical protein
MRGSSGSESLALTAASCLCAILGWPALQAGASSSSDGAAPSRNHEGRLGDPGFYEFFGFRADPRLWPGGVPPEFFVVLAFHDVISEGRVDYRAAFFEGADESG